MLNFFKDQAVKALTPIATDTINNTIKYLAERVSEKTRITHSNEISSQISTMVCKVIAYEISKKENRDFNFNPNDQEFLKTCINKILLDMNDADFSLFIESLKNYNKFLSKLPGDIEGYTTHSWHFLSTIINFIILVATSGYIKMNNNSDIYLSDREKAAKTIQETFQNMIEELKPSEAKNYYSLWHKRGAGAALFLTSVALSFMITPEQVTNLLKPEDSEETFKSLCSIQ